MNIKTLRKSYENLTMLERLSLADNAIARDDENELQAIVAASPRKHFSQVDYLDLLEQIKIFRLCNLIVRLSYITQYDYFLASSGIEFLENGDETEKYERLEKDMKMSAFLYVRATDSWKTLNDELGLRPNYDEEMSAFLFSFVMMEAKEKTMREVAYTEDEVRERIKETTGGDKIQTLEDEIKAIREALELPTN